MKSKLFTKSALILIALHAIIPFAHAVKPQKLIKPIECNGRYYYSKKDFKQAKQLNRALTFIPRKLIKIPIKLISTIVSIFYPTPKKNKTVHCIVDIPKPIQAKPTKSTHSITWVGHSTFYIQIGPFKVLTDPICGDVKAGPFTITKRNMKPGIRLRDLLEIDAVIISHDHLDHTSPKTLKYIVKKNTNVIAIVPKGNRQLFKSMGFKRVITKTWWESYTMKKNNQTLTFTCLPAKHWSLHINPFKYRKALWASWMISHNNTNIYFCGDSGYGPHFKQIGQEFPSINYALMPIGPTSLKNHKRHKHQHVNAKEAVTAFNDLKARVFVPMHYLTFFKCPDTCENPINQLFREAHAGKLNGKLLFAQCGRQYNTSSLQALKNYL